jgi:hypothetical protein
VAITQLPPASSQSLSRRARSARVARSSPAKGSSSSASTGSRAQARANNTRRAWPYDISASVRWRSAEDPEASQCTLRVRAVARTDRHR